MSWLKTLDAVEALPADIIVPGHGPIPQDPKETRQGLHRFRQMLVDLRDAVQNEINRGRNRRSSRRRGHVTSVPTDAGI